MRLLLLFVLLAYLFLLSSCKKYQAANSSFSITSGNISIATEADQGTKSHKITDLWLYVNGKYQGTYPVGHLMPIVCKDQAVRLNVFAGIKNNGIADTRLFYPFFDFITFDTLVESGKSIQRAFTFKYKSATKFAWMENFDISSGYSVNDVNSDVSYEIATPEESFEGHSLKLAIPPDPLPGVARIESSGTGFSLPIGSSNVYLELNYKCNTEFSIGLVGTDNIDLPVMSMNPQENWNKTYIQLSTALGSGSSSKYRVYFKFVNGSTTETKQIFLDNIKLLYL